MKRFRKTLIVCAVLCAVLQPIFANVAYAQFTILPVTSKSAAECKTHLQSMEAAPTPDWFLNSDNIQDTLACGIVTGNITLSMIPYFIKYFSTFLLSLVGLIAMLFVVLGGYWYVFGALIEQKEKGKKFIIHALEGMVIASLSWVIVSVVINLVTA
jgi:hypothetical protein